MEIEHFIARGNGKSNFIESQHNVEIIKKVFKFCENIINNLTPSLLNVFYSLTKAIVKECSVTKSPFGKRMSRKDYLKLKKNCKRILTVFHLKYGKPPMFK